jgi:hypothetical protein
MPALFRDIPAKAAQTTKTSYNTQQENELRQPERGPKNLIII